MGHVKKACRPDSSIEDMVLRSLEGRQFTLKYEEVTMQGPDGKPQRVSMPVFTSVDEVGVLETPAPPKKGGE